MNARAIIAVIAAVGLLTTAVGVSVLAGVNPAAALMGGEAHEPALVSFESSGAQCTEDFIANSSTSVAGGGANRVITHSQNISLPDPSQAVGGPSFDRLNDSTYVLSVPIEETKKPRRNCAGFARYEATMRLPGSDGPWRIVVEHDGETAMTLFGDSRSTGVSGSASAGGHVSG